MIIPTIQEIVHKVRDRRFKRLGSNTESVVVAINEFVAAKAYFNLENALRFGEDLATPKSRAYHELRVGVDLRSKGVRVPKMYGVIAPTRISYPRDRWILLMERIHGPNLEEMREHHGSIDLAQKLAKEERAKIRAAGYMDYDAEDFLGQFPASNAVFSIPEQAVYVIDFTMYKPIHRHD